MDAIPPRDLRKLVIQSITKHIDSRQLEMTRRIEYLERQTLEDMLARLNKQADDEEDEDEDWESEEEWGEEDEDDEDSEE